MAVLAAANPPANQPDQRITRGYGVRAWAGLILPAAAIDLPCCDARQP